MTQRITNSEILRLIEQWDQLKPTLRHGPGQLPRDIPAKVRLMPPAGFTLKDVNQGAATMRIVRFNPAAADAIKINATKLSVAAHERNLVDTAGIDAVATDS